MLNTGTIALGGTLSATGGTSTTLKTLNSTGQTHNLFLDDGSELLSQSEIAATVKSAYIKADAPNGYTQVRTTVVLKRPLALDNGSRTHNTVTIILSNDVETTDAERDLLRHDAGQLLIDSDTDEFWNNGSLA